MTIGIPVVAYNADEPGNNRLCYIGQSNTTAGAAAAARIVAMIPKGSLIGMVIATPGTGNIQPRIDGALPVFTAAGMDTATVAGGALLAQETTAVQAWWEGHKDVKFLYAVDDGDSVAVAECIAKNNLAGITLGSGWDVGLPVLQGVSNGEVAFTIDQQAYLQGFVPDGPAVPVQHLGRADEAVRHRHWSRLRNEGERGSIPRAQDAIRRGHFERDSVQASGDDRLLIRVD